jgi:hypothetical protein
VCSCFEKEGDAVKINFSSSAKLKHGMDIRYVMVDGELTYKDAVKFLDERHYVILQLFDGEIKDEITQDELYQGILSHSIYDKVFE